MNKITGRFPSSDGENSVAYYIYEPLCAPRAVIQISHGMCEYIERYERHVEYFAQKGFVLAGNDHLGHGNTAKDDGDLGYIRSADDLICDVKKMTDILRERYPDIPLFILGHSMGSFVLREYMTKYSDLINGAIISGTAGPGSPTGAGKLLCSVLSLMFGPRHRSKLILMMSLGAYSKSFGKDAPFECWLTRDKSVTDIYVKDKFCAITFTVSGNRALFDVLGRVSSRSWAKKLDKTLPALLISGSDDPVGSFGKGVTKVYERMKKAGCENLELFLIKDARHEPFNELEPAKTETYEKITSWIENHI